MFHLTASHIKGKRQFGRRYVCLLLVLQGYPTMTSGYATEVVGRFSSVFFTTVPIVKNNAVTHAW